MLFRSDGGPTYASDVLQTTPEYKGPYADPTGDLKSVICSPKGDTITFKANKPFPDMPYAATFGAFAAIPKAKDTKQNYDLRPFSNGPYKIQSYDRGKQLTLVRNKTRQANITREMTEIASGAEAMAG